jgi:hypothetical protein
MSAAAVVEKPLKFHNSRILVALLALFGVSAILIAFGMALEACSLFFIQHGHIFLRILAGLQWGLGGVSMAAIGLAFWKFALRSGFHQVRFEADRVHFRLGTRKKPLEASFAWNQISAVSHQLRPDNHYIFILGKDGSQVNYTAYDIFRYKKLARLIATRANVPLTELAPVKSSPAKRPAVTS